MVDAVSKLVRNKIQLSKTQSTFSKSLPNLHQPLVDTEVSSKFTDRIYSSTHRIAGPSSSFFISPLGSLLAGPVFFDNSTKSPTSIKTGQLLTPRTSDPYIAAQISIRTQFARPHEFEDLLNTTKLQSTNVVYQQECPTITESPSESTGLTSLLPTGHSQQDLTPSLPSIHTTRSDDEVTLKEEKNMHRVDFNSDIRDLEDNFGVYNLSSRRSLRRFRY